jgi:hypothetical protein
MRLDIYGLEVVQYANLQRRRGGGLKNEECRRWALGLVMRMSGLQRAASDLARFILRPAAN